MPTYTTTIIKNVSTGEPFVFEVSDEDLSGFETRKESVRRGVSPLLPRTVDELTRHFELARFPTFNEVLGIFMENGFSRGLLERILLDFGAPAGTIRNILRNNRIISELEPWFAGITCDGGRACRTMSLVYSVASRYCIDVEAMEKGRRISQ